MCGRFNIVTSTEALIDAFGIINNEIGGKKLDVPRYNIPPASTVPVVRLRDGQRTLCAAHWGLLPHWAKDKKMAFKTFNARAETITEKISFKLPIRKFRCIIPATGWFEWRREGDIKQPFHFHTDGVIPFAGVSTYNPGLDLLSCSIITTAANSVSSEVHHRMPVILHNSNIEAWLSTKTDMATVLALLKPYTGGDLLVDKVSTRVNSTRYTSADCIQPI